MLCWKSQNLHVMLPERFKLPSARCVMEDIRSQSATSVSLYQETWSSLNCQITFTSQIRTKAVWLKLEGHKWGIYSLFHLCRGLNNYSCILCIHVHFWQASKGCFEKTTPLCTPTAPTSTSTSTTNYHTKVPQRTALHYTDSLYRRSLTGWLKSSSPEFP